MAGLTDAHSLSGFAHLAEILDAGSRRDAGRALGLRTEAELVQRRWSMTAATRSPDSAGFCTPRLGTWKQVPMYRPRLVGHRVEA